MIIDCHGHYTTAPKQLEEYRKAQLAAVEDAKHVPAKGALKISDDEIRESLENAQLKMQRERGTDMTIFSPRAIGMGHHLGDEVTSRYWSEHCNDLIHRVCSLYPGKFRGCVPAAPEQRARKADWRAAMRMIWTLPLRHRTECRIDESPKP